MCKKRREEVITFKVDEDLGKKLRDIPNRSEFIRTAVANALNRVCPLCHGNGTLSELQQVFLDDFLSDHSIIPGANEQEHVLVCSHRGEQ